MPDTPTLKKNTGEKKTEKEIKKSKKEYGEEKEGKRTNRIDLISTPKR